MPRLKQFDEEAILNKAMELFWKKGFHGTSMQDLVDHLGINRASLYNTFGDKKSLFESALARYREINTGVLNRLLEAEPSVKEALFRMFSLSVEQSLADPDSKGCFVVNTTAGSMSGDEDTKCTLEQNKEHITGLLLKLLEKGVLKGEIPPDKNLPELASFLFTVYNGMNVIARIKPQREELYGVIRTALSVLD